MSAEMTSEEARERARKATKKLETSITQRMWNCALFSTAALLVAALMIILTIQVPQGATYFVLLAFASSSLAVISGILFLEARDHRREVRGRNWKSVTPIFYWERRPGPDAAASRPESATPP